MSSCGLNIGRYGSNVGKCKRKGRAGPSQQSEYGENMSNHHVMGTATPKKDSYLVVDGCLINSFEPNLYSLNDIHKASGGSASKKPAFYLRTLTAKRILNALPGERWEKLHVIRGGVSQGTFASQELVFAYALWLSPDFYVRVLSNLPFISDLRNGEAR